MATRAGAKGKGTAATTKSTTTTCVALLRGINVGGKHLLPMKALVSMFEDAECTDVRNYIQSGNIVFTTASSDVARVAATIGKQIAKQFGFEAPIVIRTAAQLRDVVTHNPYIAAGAPPETLYVAFLADRPSPRQIASLDPDRSPPDELTVVGEEVYLRFPNGLGRSKITSAWLDSKLGTISTARNWRTVGKLVEMSQPR